MSQKNQTNKEFLNLEKEALKEISLEIIKSDLQKFLQQAHQKEMEKLEKRISTIEERCVQEIQDVIFIGNLRNTFGKLYNLARVISQQPCHLSSNEQNKTSAT